ncbi:hypothetical protein D8B26_006179 [Coccidioides posadasii str. Silveira]|uniref:Uncharacterized protein n=2 Tax=Coccidioides posadasii TaxID=199306 RepID=E9DBE5_COCPS|nr:Serine carboxypeptidase S28 family protein [Coccidioides posadasii C735 delta SOWgp]EER27718.1 Serine carboxypeptidase S28 family protein [Coccidioides posadasii C735 delta SOWgp]EFW16097.1 conserved hypothetical protein [Coccidioides posadasii str. Silveira]QVM11532.1 hypothetical protein D8B26_006179 [Coccidioides posadasii str. Silveira]|eukprot:XP_003069863.1 Serine carboxypeptidase S28 family protein [Coccidioides posadasii C735 delta SOWgp]
MRFLQNLLGGTALALLTGLGSAFGPRWARYQNDLHLAAMLGMDADSVLTNRSSLASAIDSLAETSAVVAEYANIPIDHRNPGRMYRNRYWVNDQYYQPGGPVVIFDTGETNGQAFADYYLVDPTSYIVQLLREFHGVGLVWEHRYYGESLPYPVNGQTSAAQFQYLTLEQALQDLPYFARTFRRPRLPNADLTPRSTPWIMVGGSYPGMRAAFSRLKYPDTIFAAFSSSAPAQARIDMSVYYEQVYRGLVAYGYGNCTRDVNAAYRYIDAQLANPSTAAQIKRQFLGPGAEQNSNGDFTAVLLYNWATWQSFGANGPAGQFCNWLETDQYGRVAPAEGWAPSRGARSVVDRWAAWPGLSRAINSIFETNCNCPEETCSCDLSAPPADPLAISWSWQFCSQFGYFQYQNPRPHEIASRYQTEAYIQDNCYRQFPDGVSSGHLPRRPRADATNNYTGGWNMRPSNVFHGAGQYDPWTPLTVLSQEPWGPRRRVTTQIPACNQEQEAVFGVLLPNAEHVYDLQTSYQPGEVSRQLFRRALHQWLPCFRRRNSTADHD